MSHLVPSIRLHGNRYNYFFAQYLNMQNGITMDTATSYGFVAAAAPKFAVIGGTKDNSLSVNEN